MKESTYTLNGQRVIAKEFSEQSSFTIKGGVATIILYPSFRAGEDTLTIEIPGLPLKTIPVTVRPAQPYRVSIETPDTILAQKTSSGQIVVYDRRNNSIQFPVSIDVHTIGDIKVNNSASGQVRTAENGIASFDINTNNSAGTQYIYANIA